MKLKDIQHKGKSKNVIVTARIPKNYKDFIIKNKINLRVLICKAIDEVRIR